jgi:hypothetical protein
MRSVGGGVHDSRSFAARCLKVKQRGAILGMQEQRNSAAPYSGSTR